MIVVRALRILRNQTSEMSNRFAIQQNIDAIYGATDDLQRFTHVLFDMQEFGELKPNRRMARYFDLGILLDHDNILARPTLGESRLRKEQKAQKDAAAHGRLPCLSAGELPSWSGSEEPQDIPL